MMNKKHSQNFSDENLDRFAFELLRGTVLTDEEVEEIAASSRLWQQVRSRIADEKSRREQRRFFDWHWQWTAVGAMAAILIAASAGFWLFNSTSAEIAVARDEKIIDGQKQEIVLTEKTFTASPIVSPVSERKTPVRTAKITAKIAPRVKSIQLQSAPPGLAKTKSVNPKNTASATDFIALSYASATDSGQVVRVKVPRSMMVSLGVTTKVERASDLVNAEVVVGDDGAARAIRFLANE